MKDVSLYLGSPYKVFRSRRSIICPTFTKLDFNNRRVLFSHHTGTFFYKRIIEVQGGHGRVTGRQGSENFSVTN